MSVFKVNEIEFNFLKIVLQNGLEKVGLKINLQKSFAFIWTKNKNKIIYDNRTILKCNNQPVQIRVFKE